MSRLAAVAFAAMGAHYLASALLLGWRGIGLGDRNRRRRPPAAKRWLNQAGLGDVTLHQFIGATAASAIACALVAATLFAAPLPVAASASLGAALPFVVHRHRRAARRRAAHECWPAMIEEIRVLSGPAGLSIPQALFEVGRRAPENLRWAFLTAEREWRLSTDFDRTIARLKTDLADPTADVTLETMLVAHSLGGTGLGDRLGDLAEDRTRELAGRRDATARQAGARFARVFVLLVPLGMTLAGLSLGTGRAAYATPIGQLLVATALGMIGGCWMWASHLMRLPPPARVFDR